jgi:hypothetical protein
VRDDVVHLSRDPIALRGRGETSLLIALEFEAGRAFVQRDQQRASLSDGDAEDSRGHHEARQADPDLHRIRRRPLDRRDHRAGLHHGRREREFDHVAAQRDPVQRNEKRRVAELRIRDQPLHPGDQRQRAEHHQRLTAAQQQRQAQGRRERELAYVEAIL